MGSRMLRSWLLRPLLLLDPIRDRLDAVEELAFRTTERGKFRETIKAVQDLERLVARAALGTAGPRDLVGLRQSLSSIPRIRTVLAELQAPLVRSLLAELDDLVDVRDRIESTLIDEPGALARDGGFTRDGLDPELDDLRHISRSGKQVIAEMEERERTRTGISSLKIRYNRVFGYYIEISKSNLHAAARLPSQADDCRRRAFHHAGAQTRESARRRRSGFSSASRNLRGAAHRGGSGSAAHQATARSIATLDVLAALAETAAVNNYTKPHVHDADEMLVADSRHPVVERRTRPPAKPSWPTT
jgi:DNA mismatch repair protein MutS